MTDSINYQTVEETFTYFEHGVKKLANSSLKFDKIKLTKFPEETFSLSLQFKESTHCSFCSRVAGSRQPHYYSNSTHCSCFPLPFVMNLVFSNSLHIMSDEYHYKIRCFLKETDQDEIYLFSHSFNRTSASKTLESSTTNAKGWSTESDRKICFEINRQRKNYNGSVILNDQASVDLFFNLSNSEAHPENVTINVSGRTFHVNKQILGLRSPVFLAMFSNSMLESVNNAVTVNFDPEIVEIMLRYIYTNETKNIPGKIVEIFEAAHYYEIEDLSKVCIEYMKFSVNRYNLVSYLRLANTYNLYYLKKRINDYVLTKQAELIKRTDYQVFLAETIGMDTVVDYLNLCNKYRLLHKFKMQVFEFLKQNIDKIMKIDEFLELFCKCPTLIQEVFTYIHNKNDEQQDDDEQ